MVDTGLCSPVFDLLCFIQVKQHLLAAHLSFLWDQDCLLAIAIDSNDHGPLIVSVALLPITVIIHILPVSIECWNEAVTLLKSCYPHWHYRVPREHVLLLPTGNSPSEFLDDASVRGGSFSPSCEHSQLVHSLVSCKSYTTIFLRLWNS